MTAKSCVPGDRGAAGVGRGWEHGVHLRGVRLSAGVFAARGASHTDASREAL
jgi:hypothetical protein